jgi:hypothetical protein
MLFVFENGVAVGLDRKTVVFMVVRLTFRGGIQVVHRRCRVSAAMRGKKMRKITLANGTFPKANNDEGTHEGE